MTAFEASATSSRATAASPSRNGNVLRRYDALGDQVTAVLDVDAAAIDGEVIAGAETGRITSAVLQRGDETAALGALPPTHPFRAKRCDRMNFALRDKMIRYVS
jgi:hypothetical protein